MTISLTIDNREHKLIDLLVAANATPHTVDNLLVGDIQIRSDDETHPFKMIIERKTIADLAASIKDGRYKEQKIRLLQTRQQDTGVLLVYIVEGRIPYNEAGHVFGMSAKALCSFEYNTLFRDNITIINTLNITETRDVVAGLYKRIATDDKHKEWVSVDAAAATVTSPEAYAGALIKTRRKDNVDPKMCFVMQLCAIPGISHTKATVIIDALKVNNMRELLAILVDHDVAPKVLGQVKGIGKQLSLAIITNLLGERQP